MPTATIGFVRLLEPEDRVRADLYALLARLFFGPPDAGLLRTMGSAPLIAEEADTSPLAIAWARLAAASRVMDPDAASDEYEALFGGVGKSLISPYASYHASANTPGAAGQYLVDLRADLAGRGIALQEGQSIPEDHCAALFETMRLLIAGNDEIAPSPIEEQRAFFARFIAPFYAICCNAISQSSVANFYRIVAECSSAFLAIEDESLAIA